MLWFCPLFKQNFESNCSISWVSNFRCVRKNAKSNYQLRHVRPSVRMELGSHWTDFYESWYLSSLRNCRKKSNFVKIWREWFILHEDRFTFMTASRLILLRMWNVPDKICSKNQNTHSMLSKFFLFRKSCSLWDNVEKYCTPGQATDDNIIWRMRFSFWLTKAKDIHSECVILIAFPLQQWLRERASMYVISSC
jgi:hypothetical protein